MMFLITRITRISTFFLAFSSLCFATQTLQQCKDGLFNPALRNQVCENHAEHFLFHNSPAVGLLIKRTHYLYTDKTGVEAYTEELGCLYKDGQMRKMVLVCPYAPESKEQRKECKPSQKQHTASI